MRRWRQGQFVGAKAEGAAGSAVPVAKFLAEGKAGGRPDVAQGVMPGVAPGDVAAIVKTVADRLKGKIETR